MRDTALANSKWSARMCKGYSRRESGDATLQEADLNASTCLSLVHPRAARAVAWAVERKAKPPRSSGRPPGLKGSEGTADEEGRAAQEADGGAEQSITDLATRETPVFEVEAEWLHRSARQHSLVDV